MQNNNKNNMTCDMKEFQSILLYMYFLNFLFSWKIIYIMFRIKESGLREALLGSFGVMFIGMHSGLWVKDVERWSGNKIYLFFPGMHSCLGVFGMVTGNAHMCFATGRWNKVVTGRERRPSQGWWKGGFRLSVGVCNRQALPECAEASFEEKQPSWAWMPEEKMRI